MGSITKGIDTNANSNEPIRCAWDVQCSHPAWVKNNAILYLIGLKYYKINGRDSFVFMSQNQRNAYKERAITGLTNLNPSIIDGFGGQVMKKSFDLIQYLQAYDLLKVAGAITPNEEDDKDCRPRNKLRAFAKNMYIEAEDIINSFNGEKKNHGILCCSALIMSAIVLNEAGAGNGNVVQDWLGSLGSFFGITTAFPNYSPIRWWERGMGNGGYSIGLGEDGLEDNMFVGDHWWFMEDMPMTNGDGYAGYAEGPGYFQYCLKTLLPTMRALDNFLPPWNGKNLLHDTRYLNLLKWHRDILNPDQSLPTYDNTSLPEGNILGILGHDSFPSGIRFLPGGGEGENSYDLRGDYLLAMGKDFNTPQNETYFNENSGNIIVRLHNNNEVHTLHMLAEKGVAVDKPDAGGTHEEDDLGSFMIYAFDKTTGVNTPLAIDPPYIDWTTHLPTQPYFAHNTLELNDGNSYDLDYMDDDDLESEHPRVYRSPVVTWYSPIKLSDTKSFAFDLAYNFENNRDDYIVKAIRRKVQAIQMDGIVYYMLTCCAINNC